jgi:two-component system nitrogen regulation sensor histidine kinase GlnL
MSAPATAASLTFPLHRVAAGASGPETMLNLLNALPQPILSIDADDHVVEANTAAEQFFDHSLLVLRQHPLPYFLPLDSPLLDLIRQVKDRGLSVTEYRLDIGRLRSPGERLVDVYVTPFPEGGMAMMIQERTLTDKIDRRMTQRGATKSVSALASMLAHEIKNPLSGIRGAAQLLEAEVSDGDRALTRLICQETDRIVTLVDRMGAFSDERPLVGESVNIHVVLDHVKRVSQAGFARHIRFIENYDPSLPHVLADRDQLVQVFLNLVKNAAEAIGEATTDGEIELSTAYRPGVRIKPQGSETHVSLPLEFCVRDNGPGIPTEILSNLFDPFITTKASGTGLGLAMVAKIVGDHGGIIECDSHGSRTTFRVLMPMYAPRDGRASPTR